MLSSSLPQPAHCSILLDARSLLDVAAAISNPAFFVPQSLHCPYPIWRTNPTHRYIYIYSWSRLCLPQPKIKPLVKSIRHSSTHWEMTISDNSGMNLSIIVTRKQFTAITLEVVMVSHWTREKSYYWYHDSYYQRQTKYLPTLCLMIYQILHAFYLSLSLSLIFDEHIVFLLNFKNEVGFCWPLTSQNPYSQISVILRSPLLQWM